MSKFFQIVFLLLVFQTNKSIAQNVEAVILKRMQNFHVAMIGKTTSAAEYIDDSLSYGHSNGWVENNQEFRTNLGGRLTYHSYKEDSIRVTVNKNIAHIRFIADIDVTMNGIRNTYHLKVLEIWVKRKKDWKIFARQAIR